VDATLLTCHIEGLSKHDSHNDVLSAHPFTADGVCHSLCQCATLHHVYDVKGLQS